MDVELIQVRADDAESAHVWLEYATLVTLPFVTEEGLVVRIAGAPAMLALDLDTYARAGGRVPDSEELERVVLS